jgi:transglutaminase-like putative cysteine protease
LQLGVRVDLAATRNGRGSMRFSVRHQTRYRYSAPVRLAEHVLRLDPRPDAGRLLTRTLSIEPAPIEREETLDPFGNLVTLVAFDGLSDRFLIDSRFALEVSDAAAPRNATPSPLPWPVEAAGPNAAYRGAGEIDATVRDFAAELASASGGDALAFLDRLNEALFVRIRHDIRDDGTARPAEATLALGHGACRDVTNLFLAACRSLGAPARFVSGYQARAETPDGRRHLHAWPEAFVAGLGWRAYDPTHGVRVTDGHVGLCAAPEQAATMPVEGEFYGGAVTSTLNYQIAIATEAE